MEKNIKGMIIKSACEIGIIVLLFLSCARNISNNSSEYTVFSPEFDENGYWRTSGFMVKKNADNTYDLYGTSSLYGTYLAARTAHMRQDFATAAEYYKLAKEKDEKNKEVNQTIYVILSLIGEIDQAAPYAQEELKDNPHESTALLIMAVKNFADKKYEDSRKNIEAISDEDYKNFILPFFAAWSYAAEGQTEKAIEEFEKAKKNASLIPLLTFHEALVYDVANDKKKAAEKFTLLISEYPQEVTYRILEISTDFFARYGDKETAHRIISRYDDDGLLASMLANFKANIDKKTASSPAIINTPQKGLAEAVYNIGTIFRLNANYLQYAHEYISAASYLNPEYDVSKIALANILEEQGLFKEANRYYQQIDKKSGSYFIARLKLIENYNSLKEYDKAEQALKELLKDYPDNTQLLGDLGNLASLMDKQEEAIKIYHKAIASTDKNDKNSWPLYYALAASYDKLGRHDQTEIYLKEALRLSDNNPNVLNYLGYFWLMQDKNVDQAAQMIVDAYKQYPFEGHIIDSIGWLYYRIGNYEKAIAYLERASDINPGNAVVSDHLGDAYWAGGRKNEAVFQWKHALTQKEDAELINIKQIKQKIEEGGFENKILLIREPMLNKALHDLSL